MKSFNKALIGVAVAAAMATSAHAALTTVQGVSWDTEATNPVNDFKAQSSLTQWYQTSSAFNPTGPVISFSTPGALVGSFVTGAGKFFTVNGVNQVANDPNPETTPAIFAPGRELTLTYGGIEILSYTPTGDIFTFDLTNSFVRVYSDAPPNYTENSSSLAEQMDASDTDFAMPFFTGRFDTFNLMASLLTNGTLAGFADGLVSVTGGAAFKNFDTNKEVNPDGVSPNSDLSFTGSSQIGVGASISNVATGEFQGDSMAVPEPAALALFGIAMLAAGTASRRRRTND